MTQTLRTVVISALVVVLSLLAVVAVKTPTYAQNTKNGTRCGSQIELGEKNCTLETGDRAASNSLEKLIKTVINILSAVVGAVSVIMIIVGGFRYVTSGGDSNNVGAAKNTILYAIVGLVIVAVAQVIVQFVLERTTTS